MGQFARDIGVMPGALPLTGAVLTLHADSGNPDPLASAHSADDWRELDVTRSIEAFASAPKDSMPDNYLLLKANPGSVDWIDDDDGWKTIVDHYRVAAKLARSAGLRGLLLDFEPYTQPFRQFEYSRQSGAKQHSFIEYRDAARRRGREVMSAIASEFPDAEIGTFFLLSYLTDDHHYRGPSPVNRNDALWCLAGHSYGLLPAFVDGWLDNIPPQMTIIDGCENAYWFHSESQFQRCAEAVRERGIHLVSEANRSKYENQVRVAFPVYLDAIHPTLAGKYTIQPQRIDRLELMRDNLSAAIAAGDGLVWLYGEHGRWWPEAGDEALWAGKDNYPTWETNLPGISALIKEVVDQSRHRPPISKPASGSSTAATTDSTRTDLADEPVDQEGKDEIGATVLDVQPEWTSRREGETGDVQIVDGQVTISGARDGSGLATIETEPNRRYMVQVQVVQQGRGMTRLALRWRTPDGKWESTMQHDVVAYPPDGDPLQPRTITAIVQSPPQPHRLVVICNASKQLSQDDAALFGNLMIGLVDE